MKALCLAFGAALAFAQNPPQLEVRGTVIESGLGVAGATVTLYEFGHEPTSSTTRTVFATTSTDAKGEFTFHPSRTGEYYVEVQKEGYFAESFGGPSVDPIDYIGDPVSLAAAHPVQERRFTMMRLGELRGRVIDEDGKPLANLRVGLRPATSTQMVTDQDGYFVATKLRPGDYQVWIVPQHGSQEILPQFSASDLEIVDEDLETSSWPGTPLPVRAGASLNVGTITAHKAPYYRAHLSVESGECAPDEKWTFSTTPGLGGFGPQVPCRKEFLVRNLAPGQYTFMLSTTGRPGDERRWAILPVEVTDKNLEIALTMSVGSEIGGRIVAAEGATLPPGKMTIDVTPLSARVLGRERVALDSAGRFLIHGKPGDRSQISVDGLAAKFYVQEIRYNGVAIADGIITPIAGSPSLLEIVIDDKAANISGSVAGRDKVSGRVVVIAMKWPLSADSTLLGNADTEADDQGRFQIGGLAPGEYCVLALTEDTLIRLNRAAVRLSNGAEKVTLERGNSRSLSLKMIEP